MKNSEKATVLLKDIAELEETSAKIDEDWTPKKFSKAKEEK